MNANRILLILDHRANRRLLSDSLSDRYEVSLYENQASLDQPFDLGIIDGLALDHLQQHVLRRKQIEQPAFLPFLLVTTKKDVGMATRHLWKSIDEIIVTPIQKLELAARVSSLLKTRQISLEFTRKIVHYSPNAFLLVDQHEIIRLWNKAAESIFGWEANELVGRKIDDLSIAEIFTQMTGMIKQVLSGDGSAWKEISGITRQCERCTLSVTALPLFDDESRISHALVVIEDITQIKAAQEQLAAINEDLETKIKERTEELITTNQELEAFARTVSHDLRAPLRAIMGFSQALREDYVQSLDEDGQKMFARIEKNAMHMNQLIDDLMRLSRYNRMEVNYQRVDLSEIARSIVEDLQASQPERQVDIQIQPNLIAYGDKGLLTVLIDNLFNNAWKFTSAKSQGRIDFFLQEIDGENVFTIQDNGIGFDMTYADKLFGVFQRLHPAESYSGTGIGLATVKRIILRHGGKVWAAAKVNEGAVFYFTLPEKKEDQ